MLNELYDLSLSLEKAGIPTEEWHKNLLEIKKTKEPRATKPGTKGSVGRKTQQAQGTPSFVVSINCEGNITDLEQVGQARLDGVRYWQTGNGVSFPCFNVRPLFKTHAGDTATAEEQRVFNEWVRVFTKSDKFTEHDEAVIRSHLLTERGLWDESQEKRIAKCLVDVPRQLLERVGQPPDDYRAVKEIIGRSAKLTPGKLFSQLSVKIVEQIRKAPGSAEDLIKFLLYVGEKKPGNSILLVLELDDGLSEKFKHPVINRKTFTWINAQLLASETKRHTANSQSKEVDAFGLPIAGWNEKYGGLRKVGIFGDVILRAMSKDSPCQYRYGLADFNSYIAGAELRKRAKGALKWLTAQELKDKTWGSVALASGDQEILLVYPSELPDIPVAAVAMFGGSITNTETQAARFVECSKNVTDALRSIPRPLREIDMRVFALRKMDKARTQVSCNRHYSAARLVAAAEEWQSGCGNVPTIQIKQWGKEKGSVEWNGSEAPFPLEVIWCLNTVWNMVADTPSRVREFSSSEGIGLLLDEGVRIELLLERALHAAIRNGGNLLIAMAQADHSSEIHNIGGKYEKQKLLLPAMLGLFLAKLGIKKEEYMKSAPYLIGRMLSLADQIHYHYCQHVRNKQTPTQLIGNALMATALEEPEKALALYAQRILPYQAWARTFKGNEEDQKRVRGTLKQLGETCSEVSLENVPDQCADTDKAQMLLGYLARFEKPEQPSAPI